MPMGPGFWHPGQGIQVARRWLTTSSKARGKVPAVVLLPLEMDEELVWWLQQEEAHLGWDAATLEVVMETAGYLMRGQ